VFGGGFEWWLEDEEDEEDECKIMGETASF
jgi:hypothetical protein